MHKNRQLLDVIVLLYVKKYTVGFINIMGRFLIKLVMKDILASVLLETYR